MQRGLGGYTIVELTIVMAVSVAMLAIAMTFLSGSEDHTRFSASMKDAQSKMQDWINDVPTGFPGGTSGKTALDANTINCTVGSSARPQVTNTSIGPNNPDCIFLGKVIQVTENTTSDPSPASGQDSHIYAYSVFGRRSLIDSGTSRLVANMEESNPTPIVGISTVSGGTVDLTEDYQLNGSARVLSVTSQAVSPLDGSIVTGQSHLMGIFLSFNQLAANRNGAQDLQTYLYSLPSNQLPGNDHDVSDNVVDDCISLASPCAKTPASLKDNQWPQAMQQWQICFGNPDNSDTAVLTVSSSAGTGASTTLEFKACS